MNLHTNRRRVLRGMLSGAAVTVGLPFLECFLNTNGTALASGAPLPTRFGTWFWGLGMNKQIWVPKKTGKDYDLPAQVAAFKDVKQHINMFSNYNVLLDGRPNLCHYTGWIATRVGECPAGPGQMPGQTLDVTVEDVIGAATRFRSITLSATGNPRTSYSYRSADAINPPDASVSELYQKIFGPDFQDPNAPEFKPDPKVMARKSVLSGVIEHTSDLKKTLGAADKARLDAYLSSVRSFENSLAIQLQKPPPAEACKVPTANEKEVPTGLDAELVASRHNMMVDLMIMALACNQTRIFNMGFSEGSANTTHKGVARPHHPTTHEEPTDPTLGYQPISASFITESMGAWAYLVKAMADFKEGDGSLLDHSLVLANSDCELAQIHALNNMPMMTAGRAGGRLKSGYHIDGAGGPVTAVSLTVLQAMGLQATEFGKGGLKTSQPVAELLA